MSGNRRSFLRKAFTGAGLLAGAKAWAVERHEPMPGMDMSHPHQPMPMTQATPNGKGKTGGTFLPVESPDLPKLLYELDNGVKVFHLVAEPVKREFLPGFTFDLWGYNGSVPGPTIEAVEGDRVRLIVDNHLPEPTSIHWHGFEVPIEMDGVPGVTQDPIPPGGRFVYEFTLHQNGTFFYHSHMAMQEMLGMIGLFIMHPKQPHLPPVDKDFGIVLQEWAILPNNTVPNTLSMEFNWLTLNGKAGPATMPLIVKQGERVRIRMVNLGMDHHPIHLHGHQFYITGTEGGRAPESTWYPTNTVLVGVAQGKDIEFEAKYLGDWMLHCHLPHHMMNHMASMVGPMAHVAQGMHAGMGMVEGMGVVRQDRALSEKLGPSLGRAIGIGADFEKPTTNMALELQAGTQAHDRQHMQNMPGMPPMGAEKTGLVPGYPQDMFMPMDEAVMKPETYGLRPTWSGSMMGMMTLVRVLPPELYDKIVELKKQQQTEQPKRPSEPHRHPASS